MAPSPGVILGPAAIRRPHNNKFLRDIQFDGRLRILASEASLIECWRLGLIPWSRLTVFLNNLGRAGPFPVPPSYIAGRAGKGEILYPKARGKRAKGLNLSKLS